ncbi:Hint domain-containing homing endonuclease [Acinetobacter indicus]|uniref:Hint domain-containing homing endonuclease n=1 Tax=Acinetobacter indicus TaxID=756892 RepID=UPI00209B974D|nr:Hint domain-containing homing endonuclease [Acinetobacter indicus]MCO8088184.1 terminase [Acinetobacter indicus]
MGLKSLELLPEWKFACERYRYDIGRFAVEACNMSYTWQQDELFNSVAIDGSRTSVSSGHGCFAKGTPIMLADRTVLPVEDITIHHFLMGDDGQSRREVLYLERGQEEMFCFTYADGTQHTFNKSHILVLKHLATGEDREITVSSWLKLTPFERHRYGVIRRCLGELHLIPIHSVESLGMGDYYGFLVDGNHRFLAGDGTIFHNTGKTRSAGIVALWHLCFFPHSVMMFSAPQIEQLRKLVWKEIEICLSLMRNGRLAWLADYVQVLAESVYIKGHQKTWHVYAKTAPKGNPQALAGNHGDYLTIWVDEAAAVDNGVFDVLTGALTHPNNRMVLTSQPAKPSGFFFDTHHKLSTRAGGVWNSLIFNSEDSPLVADSKIRESLMQYGSRDDPQYMVRIRGEFPDLAGEFLVTQRMAERVFQGAAIKKQHQDYGYFILVDVGGGVGRDDSTITIAKVWGSAQWGDSARRADITRIPLCKNNDDVHELTAVINECLIEYPNATLLVDANGAGTGLAQNLKSLGIFFRPIHWGSQCFSNKNRKEYVNKRAQAYVCLSRAIAQGRFRVRTAYLKSKVTEQLTRIPYTFDDQARFKILSKEEMRRKGISSPDIVDTFAFIFLEGMNYTPANEGGMLDPATYEESPGTAIPASPVDSVNEMADLMS